MKIYLASTTTGMSTKLRDKTVEQCKPRYLLETFFNGENKCLKVMGNVGNDSFLLDSGAFSFMNGTSVTAGEMEVYVEKYMKFISKYQVKNFFEIDVDSIFGLRKVEYWRNKMEAFTGKKCIPVWHKSRGVEYWKQICREYDYVAIGGFAINDIKKQEYDKIKQLVLYANNRGVRVHGLGFTKIKQLKEYGFYSVDSSSWMTAAARGQVIYHFQNGSLTQRKINKDKQRVDIGKLAAHNMIEWVKYQKFMEDIRI